MTVCDATVEATSPAAAVDMDVDTLPLHLPDSEEALETNETSAVSGPGAAAPSAAPGSTGAEPGVLP